MFKKIISLFHVIRHRRPGMTRKQCSVDMSGFCKVEQEKATIIVRLL